MAISKKAGAKKARGGAGAAPKAAKKPYAPGGVAKADWREGFKKPQAGVSDMTLLTQLTNEAINENLKKRFFNQEIYTYIGNVLISVNPFRDLGLYTPDVLESYRGKNRLEMRPHVYAIAEGMFYNMQAYHDNQCVIISGESGAGKTEAAKQIMQYIAAVSGDQGSGIENVKQMVLATNPLLESFGCAKTLRNNNSSRHGKYLEIMFNAQGAPIGANITNYLLEKNRVVGQIKSERNFHIFYQLAKGASPAQRELFGLQGPEAYQYTAGAKCLDVEGIDDVQDFAGTIQAMNVIGLAQAEQDSIFRMIAAILWLGNTQFSEDKDGNAQVADSSVTDYVGYLLEVDGAALHRALTIRIMETMRGMRRGSVYEVPLNPPQAESVRDALAKAIYNNLFDWIVARVNQSMQTQGSPANVIGVLDIYGFEIFDNNSFEQLCINYVNEKLQQIFIQLTLKREQEEYASEQIKWTPIKFFNNKIVCDLIEEKRPPGVFAALNDACATAHADPNAADQSFSQRLSMLSSNPHFDGRGNKFLVRHYAGDVMYNIKGMTDKNKDALLKGILDLVDSSQNQFLNTLFPDRPDPSSKKRPPTAGDRIKTSANALVDKLMKSQPSYIRTIKPNQTKRPTDYDDQQVLHQIKYLGLQENIRVRRAGFAYRNTFEKMVERFYLLSPNTSYAGEYTWDGDARSGCEQILKDTGIARDEWQMGQTKAFIKNPETLFALETMRDRYWHNMAMRIQRAFRNYLRYKHECARRIQRMWMNKKEAIKYVEFRDYGHQLLQGHKERRRFSLISMRKFMGDYLDINGGSVEGDLLRRAAGIGNTPVTFSSRGQILVHRALRSSRPSPRFILLTEKELLIVVTQLVNKQPTTMLERKVPLASIAQVSMSQLRDDWIVINTRGQDPEGDLVLHCYLKTELAARLSRQTRGNVRVNVSNALDYAKKKGKRAQISFKKDEMIRRDDEYKSHVVSVPSGEPMGSLSRPPARRKPGVVRPVTTGKLLKAGGPSNPNRAKQAARARPTPKAARPLPSSNGSAAPAVAAAPAAGMHRAPPAPPAAEPEEDEEEDGPSVPMYKALYDFAASSAGEMSLTAGEVLEVEQQADNGWWLVKKDGVEAWAPSAYLELVPPKPKKPRVRRAPPAPAPPAPTPAASGAPAPAARTAKPKFQPVQSSVRAENAHAVATDTSAAPVAVMPGMGAPGGFAELLAKKKAAIAAANGNGGAPDSAPSSGQSTPRPPIPPKPKPGAATGRKMPPPPPRR